MKIAKVVLAASMLAAMQAWAQQPPAVDRYAIPSTVSPQMAAQLKTFGDFLRRAPAAVEPKSVEEWDKNRADVEKFFIQFGRPTVDALKPTVVEQRIGKMPVVRVRPAGWQPTGRTLMFIHGGGYVTGSTRSSIAEMAVMASISGDEVIGIEYSKAPRGTWKLATDEVLAVWQALLSAGIPPQSVGLYGSSAGGGLAAGAVLKMRDKGLPLPGALYLQSPWADITPTGETITTLAAVDPILTSESLAWGANRYADPKDQRNPYVSPVYGDYSKAFPPTLIQVGTREIFLSHAVRQYQAIRSGGHEAVLDVYEGVPHGFPSFFADTPEGRTAFKRASEFFKGHLSADNRRRIATASPP